MWGINFERHIRRKNETVFWSPIPKAYGLTRVSLAGELTGLRGLSLGWDLKLKPFLVGGVRDVQTSRTVGSRSAIRDIGFDARYGVTAGLNLDVTVNTDFAQVEVDEQQVNLTRFGLFFPEKRDFFLENSNLFTVGTGQSFTSAPVQTDLFFSRRIGLSDTGTPIPILGGVRLAANRAATTSACSTCRPKTPSAGPAKTSSSAATAATSSSARASARCSSTRKPSTAARTTTGP